MRSAIRREPATAPPLPPVPAPEIPTPGSRLPAPGSRLPAPGSRLPATFVPTNHVPADTRGDTP